MSIALCITIYILDLAWILVGNWILESGHWAKQEVTDLFSDLG